MKKVRLFLLFILTIEMSAQVGIGTTNPHVSSILDITSTNGGLLIPRMTLAQKNAITTPANGLLIFQTDGISGFWYYNGTTWITFSSSGWNVNGNSGTNPLSNYIGTNDLQDAIIATNNTERIRIKSNGNVGINQNNPTAKLHITGTSPIFRLVDGNQGNNKILTSDSNGNATWGSSASLVSPDADWIFVTGSAFSNPVYHQGKVVIGKAGTTTHHLDIDNGANTGTTFGVGNVEYITDGNNETSFSHRVVPLTDNTNSFGFSSLRWNTIYATNGTIQTSDGNQKSNIKPLTYGLKEIMALTPVMYYWKDEKYNKIPIPENDKQLKLGLIAQDVEKIIPEVVYTYTYEPKNEKESNIYVKQDFERIGINYEELLPVIIKAKQEQDVEITKLKSEVEFLAKKVKQILKS